MSRNELDSELIRRCHDGEASAGDLAMLENRLREDAAFRETYVRYMNLAVALETAEAALEAPPVLTLPAASGRAQGSWFSWCLSTATAAGLVVGLLSASVAWALALPWLAEARVTVETIFTESFESNVTATLPGLPRDCGVWTGDEAAVVTAEQGVAPKSGGKMLRFVSATHPGENSPRSLWGDVYRLVDVRGLARKNHSLARLSARFAEASVAPGEQYACCVEVIALDQDQSALPPSLLLPWAQQNGSATGSRMLPLVANRQWQAVSVEVPLSPQTQFVLLHLAAIRKTPIIQTGAVRFSGHYLDDITLELVSRYDKSSPTEK
jgi:hypothetical protein